MIKEFWDNLKEATGFFITDILPEILVITFAIFGFATFIYSILKHWRQACN